MSTIFTRFALAAVVAAFLVPQAAQAACGDPPAPKVNWSGCDKRGANLLVTNLRGADLSGANLGGAILSRADLSGAILSDANLRAADLSGANLGGADLTGATWTGGKKKCLPRSIGDCK